MSAVVEPTVPPAPLRRTLRLARPVRGRLTVAVLLGAGSTIATIGLLATSAWLISRASQQPSITALGISIVAVRFFAISRGLLRYGERLVGHDAALRVLAELRVRCYERLERLAPGGLPAFRRGDLLARLVRDIDALQDLMVRVVPPYASAAIAGLVTCVLLWWVLPASAVILAAAIVLSAGVVPLVIRWLAGRAEVRQAAVRGELSTTVVDLLDGLPDLVAAGAAPGQLARVARADAELRAVSAAAARTAGVGAALTTLIGGLAVWASLVAGVQAVTAGRLDGVMLAVAVLTPLAAAELMAALPPAAQTLEQVRRSATRVFEVLDAPDPVVDPPAPATVPPAPHEILAVGVGARYSSDRPPAIASLDLDLGPGRRVGIVGPSGAGKSTLAAVLTRCWPYDAGSVALDGIELDRLAGDDVRRVVGLAEQDAHLFEATLGENLRLARPDASDDELRVALARARLWDWVARQPLGLGTPVGTDGSRLSGGQRQRLAMARVLLADFPVVVLDEPGEHLDVATADALVADLVTQTAGRATLLISHRLAGMEAMDEVLVLIAGRVVERGRHAELATAGGWYAERWQGEAHLAPRLDSLEQK